SLTAHRGAAGTPPPPPDGSSLFAHRGAPGAPAPPPSRGIRTSTVTEVATETELAALLAASGVPETVTTLLEGAPAIWLMSASAELLAGDLEVCAGRGAEPRAAFRPLGGTVEWRLAVCAPDKRGLLAATAAAVAERGLSVRDAGVGTWPDGLA